MYMYLGDKSAVLFVTSTFHDKYILAGQSELAFYNSLAHREGGWVL